MENAWCNGVSASSRKASANVEGLVYSQQSARTPEDFNTAIAGRIPPSGGPIGSDAIPLFELVQEQGGHRKFPALAFSFARKLQFLRHTHIYIYIYDAQFLDTLG